MRWDFKKWFLSEGKEKNLKKKEQNTLLMRYLHPQARKESQGES